MTPAKIRNKYRGGDIMLGEAIEMFMEIETDLDRGQIIDYLSK